MGHARFAATPVGPRTSAAAGAASGTSGGACSGRTPGAYRLRFRAGQCSALLLGIHAMRRSEPLSLMGLTSLGWADVCLAYFLPPLPAGWLPAWHCCPWPNRSKPAARLFVLHENAVDHRGLARLCIALAWSGWATTANFVAAGSILQERSRACGARYCCASASLPLGLRWVATCWCSGTGGVVIWFAVAARLLAGLADISTMATGSGVLGNVGTSLRLCRQSGSRPSSSCWCATSLSRLPCSNSRMS